MKATGIVRRIDDLGRVVIPKEIRRVMRIREGDPLEIFTNRDGEVIFKKYSPIGEFSTFASQYAETLNRICSLSIVITDRDMVVASAGVSKKEYTDKKLNGEYEALMETRSLYSHKSGKEKITICDGASGFIKHAMPIASDGDVIGCIAMIITDENQASENDAEAKLIQTAASFLGRQFEG